MPELAFRGGRLLGPDGLIDDGDLRVSGERIAWLGRAGEAPGPAVGVEVIDTSDCLVAPGFIDLQINGAAGLDLTADPASMWLVASALPRSGVTSFLPTIVTAPAGRVEDAASVLAGGPPSGWRGALPLGLHVEGPFLSPERHGAHDRDLLRVPADSFDLTTTWSREAGISIVTLAPELPGALDLIRTLVARGVVVSAGHSMATLEQGRDAIEAGVRYATHLFNAMPPLAHRDPGLAAALLLDDRVSIGVIADGVHVHPAMVDLVHRIVGAEWFSAVTDAVAALGAEGDQTYLADQAVTVEAGGPRLADGRLAGSVLTMDQALRNVIAFTGCSAADAVSAATAVPARLLGMSETRGVLRTGALADLVVLTPQLQVRATYIGGHEVWHA